MLWGKNFRVNFRPELNISLSVPAEALEKKVFLATEAACGGSGGTGLL